MNLPTPAHPLLDALWRDYARDVPAVQTFARLCGGSFENDHVALRTLKRARAPAGSGIDVFASVFARLGWRHGGDYTFDDVHLRAIHMVQPGLPRVFISELDVDKLPIAAQDGLARLAPDAAPPIDRALLPAWFCAPPPPRACDLDAVAAHSQYGAWLLAFGRRVNHFTGRVDDVAVWQQRMRGNGVAMKDDIEGGVDGELRQTATQAARVDVRLADGSVRRLPYAYFEIAQRRVGFDGFLRAQARQLFDMTRS